MTPDASSALLLPAGTVSTEPSPRAAGLRDILALSPGVVPFGVMLGVAAVTSGTGGAAAAVGAVTVFGGSAQLTTITLLHLGAGLASALVAGAVVNARIMLYGAALEPWFRHQPLWFRLLAPQFIQDQTYLSAVARKGYDRATFRRYWAWLAGTLLWVWTGSVILGVLLAPVLPPLPHLGLVGTALFVAMLVPRLGDRPALVGAGVSGLVAVVVSRMAPELGILAGATAGVLVAMVCDRGSSS